jgi:hypothetical protein
MEAARLLDDAPDDGGRSEAPAHARGAACGDVAVAARAQVAGDPSPYARCRRATPAVR